MENEIKNNGDATDVSSEIETNENSIEEDKTKEPTAEITSQEDEKKANGKKARKKIIGYAGFILVNALVIVGFLLLENRNGDIAIGAEAVALLEENVLFTILAFLMFFVTVFCDVITFYLLSAKQKLKHGLRKCISVSFVGRYYDRVTPWATGGEPMQIAYLCKQGVSVGDSGAITMGRHIIRFFVVAIAVILILSISQIATNVWVMVAAIVSILAGLIVPIFMLICAWKPNLGQKIGHALISFLHKIKILKNTDKAYAAMQKNVDAFLSGIRYLGANKWIIGIIAVCALTELFATNSVPFFVMKALGVPDVTFWNTFVLCLFVNYASSFAPTPGGAGIAELSFYAIFAAHIGGGMLFWTVLFWRIATFYVPVAIGFVMQVVFAAKEIRLAKKLL